MIPILAAILLLLLSVNFVVGFDDAVILVSSTVSSSGTPNNQVIAQPKVEDKILPPKSSGTLPPNLSALGVLVKDVNSGTILHSVSPDTKLPIASTTKIMTALVAVNHFDQADELEVMDLSEVSGAKMGLRVGERLTFRSLLYGMLLNSGNDAAYTISQNYPGGKPAFIAMMNQTAKELGLKNTNFDNPAGFDSRNHYSSAADLAVIARAASENTQLMKVVGTKETQVSSIDLSAVHNLKNLNQLLNLPGVIGFKTGYTPIAKENFVGLIERDKHRIITVVLGSDDRFGETEQLINWTYTNFTWDY